MSSDCKENNWNSGRNPKSSSSSRSMSQKDLRCLSKPPLISRSQQHTITEDALQINSLSFTYEGDQAVSPDFLNSAHISPHFSRPVDLRKPEKSEKNPSGPYVRENSAPTSSQDEVQRLKELLRRTRKENTRKIQELEESCRQQLLAQSQGFEEYIAKLNVDFAEAIKAKDEEIAIMNSLMNNPCETELYSRSTVLDIEKTEKNEELLRKYERRLKELEELNDQKTREIEELRENNKSLVKENMKLRGYVPQKKGAFNKENKGNIDNLKETSQVKISQENKDKMLQNLLFRINKYIDSNSIESEITPANKNGLYEKISARDNPAKVQSNYNTTSEETTRRSTRENYTSREEDLESEEENWGWLDNSIKNLNVRRVNNH